MPITEQYTALERGTVEGVGGDLDSMQEMGLAKFLKYRIEPNSNVAGIIIIVNADNWDHLPPKVQDLITNTGYDYEKITMNDVAAEQRAVKAALEKQGQEVIRLTGETAKLYVDTYMKTPWGRMKSNPNIHINVDELKRDWY
jgi:TRAP-type C4-dicarboxylate transport system substrate-binding protein